LTALAEARAAELAEAADQGELFGAVAAGRPEGEHAVVSRKSGRPVGSRTTMSLQAVRWYIGKHGDPLEPGIAVAALPILAPGVIEGLSQRLQMTPGGG
jgi:hypothetical protein